MDDTNLSRRIAISTVVKAGGTALSLGAISQLVGCDSAQRRANKRGGSIGEPIPNDPIAHAHKPAPVTSPTNTPQINPTPVSLSTLPSFVIPRSKWTSDAPKKWLADPMTRLKQITVHHDAIMPIPSGSYADSVRRLRVIRTGHLNNGWADIGYHFAIDPKGRVWQARPLELQGAHVKYHNPGNLGIVVFGNYEKIRPTQDALHSLDQMIEYAMRHYSIPLNRVHTHQELRSTACPGRYLQEQMRITRSAGGRLAMKVNSYQTQS